MKQKIESYFDTMTQAVDAAQDDLDSADAVPMAGNAAFMASPHWTQQIFDAGHLAYGTTRAHHFELLTLKGKQTRKWFHVTLYRTDGGRYEMVSYIL